MSLRIADIFYITIKHTGCLLKYAFILSKMSWGCHQSQIVTCRSTLSCFDIKVTQNQNDITTRTASECWVIKLLSVSCIIMHERLFSSNHDNYWYNSPVNHLIQDLLCQSATWCFEYWMIYAYGYWDMKYTSHIAFLYHVWRITSDTDYSSWTIWVVKREFSCIDICHETRKLTFANFLTKTQGWPSEFLEMWSPD